jgi:sulfur carrier protein ThiS adenylyltransferase
MNMFEQGLLRYLKPEQLQKIQSYSIGIAGAGGLGSNIANCLVRSGFKNFTIVDKDIIEASNLNRQYYFLDEIGKPKAETLQKRLRQINPDIVCTAQQALLTEENSADYFRDCDVVFEAFDGAITKKMFIETLAGSSAIVISGNGMAGLSNKTPLLIKKIHAKLFIVGDQATQVGPDNPPFAPRVVACAALMASVALEIACQK